MSTTHYDHTTGTFSVFDLKSRQFEERFVHYLDSPAPVDHVPKLANLAYQNDFAEFAFDVLDKANKNAKVGFVLDTFRSLDQLPGARLVDGNFVIYLVRADKAGTKDDGTGNSRLSDAGYRYEMRAFDSIPYFDNENRKALKDLMLRELKAIDEKD